MSKSENWQDKAKSYFQMENSERLKFLNETYNNHKLTIQQIAEMCGTYPNKIRRDAKSLGMNMRSRSEAQSLSLQTGRHKHPTQGTTRTEEEKRKISASLVKSWASLDEEDMQKRVEAGKKYWESLTAEEKQNLLRSANAGARNAAKSGSKLELFIKERLTEKGLLVEFHKERGLVNQKLQVDLFLPERGIAIEVDGPSHFLPIWGEETLERNRKADAQKAGLILGYGWCLIRVRQNKDVSLSYQYDLWERLWKTIEDIKANYPPSHQRLIIIE